MEERERVPVHLKDSFKKTEFYDKGLVYLNERKANTHEDKLTFWDYIKNMPPLRFPRRLAYDAQEEAVMRDDAKLAKSIEIRSATKTLADFGLPALQYAFDNLPFFRYRNLRGLVHRMSSLKRMIECDLPRVQVEIRGLRGRLDNLSQKEKREIALWALQEISGYVKANDVEYLGTTEFQPRLVKELLKDYMFAAGDDPDNDPEGKLNWANSKLAELRNINLFDKAWFVYDDNYGTTEEKQLIRYFAENEDIIKRKYSEFYLVRNEQQIKIFNFADGKPTEPDFILFAREDNTKPARLYQIFIEPKGEQLLEKDKWKEDLLLSIASHATTSKTTLNDMSYKLVGMPFFNEEKGGRKINFDEELKSTLGI
jgi:type III restriction enzyme